MAIEDTSWKGQIYQLGLNHRAARFRRWFKRDGAEWIFAGSFGHRFRIDTKTAATIFAEGVNIEHEATVGIPSANNLISMLPLGCLGLVPLIWAVTYGPTPMTVVLWAAWLCLAVFVGGKTDNSLLLGKCRMRRRATRKLLAGQFPNWRSFAPLHWSIVLYELFGLAVVLAISGGFLLAELGLASFKTVTGLAFVLVVASWGVHLWAQKFIRRLDEETTKLHGAAPISPDLARRLRTETVR